ncbi:MAG: PorT family protein [Bacteroidetes bacterium]|nr:PorT family protein [Bacteroidota bacterium]
MYKRLIILGTWAFLFASQSIAQDHIKAGLKGGFSLTTLRGPEHGFKPGFQFGGVVVLGANEPVFFQTELLLTQKGSWGTEGSKNNFGLFYIEIPLMLGVEITEKFFMNAGFQPAYLLSGSYSTPNGGQSEYTNSLNKFDYSTLISAEYYLKTNFFMGIRYTHGFVPITENYALSSRNGQLPVNRLFGIYCGYMLR